MAIASSIAAVCMAIFALFIRSKAAQKPATAKKIILPPLFMSTGALMFLHPMFHVTQKEVMEALIIGVLFSLLLIKTSSFEIKGDEIYMKRSKAFMFILIGLLVVRIILKSILSTTIEIGELSGMFWILAFGMIVPWRIAMYFKFNKLKKNLAKIKTR